MVWYSVVNGDFRPVGRQVMLFETTRLIFRPAFHFETRCLIWSLTYQFLRRFFLSLLDSFYALWILRLSVSIFTPHQGEIFETRWLIFQLCTFWDTADQLILPVSFCWILSGFPSIFGAGFLIRPVSFRSCFLSLAVSFPGVLSGLIPPVSKWQT